ncbi:HNH endonuclease [Anaerovibrio lipolyticus DSM 3074]|uniref:HNH endonuclease n=1 Tax=Anaerovibrio lipolyticus DSM 3074 TaxID=1120997 RepID=A0A1M6G7G2_9FIRM|nr:HNH endonuclease signature motif containing protein [Anaerovibrio lipolyticus]SHJ05834.1 HNH endonuclease [Anaerovibrio lipolyticus DSM 3074]
MLIACGRCGKIHERGKCAEKPISMYKKKTTKQVMIRHSTRWARVREQALERDCYLCRLCLADGYINHNSLEVHHIIKIEENQDLAYELGNLLTLCSSHHKEVEDDKGKRDYLRELASTKPTL